MKDAASEAKRDTVSNAQGESLSAAIPAALVTSLGEYAAAVNATLAEAHRA